MVTLLIVNASPLISLGKIDGLRLLGDPLFRIYVPQPVVDEVVVQTGDPAAQWLGTGHAVQPPAPDPDAA